MRRIEIDNGTSDNKKKKGLVPWGLFWRYLLFLILLFLFLLLLKWLLSLGRDGSDSDAINLRDNEDYIETLDEDEINNINIEIPEEYNAPVDGDINPDLYKYNPELKDVFEEPLPDNRGNFSNPIPELPSPDDNYIVPTDPRNLVNPDGDPYREIDGTLIDVILDDISEENFNNFVRRVKQIYPGDNVKVKYYNPESGLLQLKVNPNERENVKQNIRSRINDIEYKIFDDTRFNSIASASGNSGSASTYNDPAFKSKKKSWHFAPIQAFEAWDITKGSEDIVVAVIDSYIDITHPEFKGRIVKPYSVERKSRNVLPPSRPYTFGNPNDGSIYHGTHVAALAVGALNNGQGAAGLAPNCKLMPISLGENMSTMAIMDAILYAINQGADVINLSIASLFREGTDKIPINQQLEYINNVKKYQEDVWEYVYNLADKKNVTIVWAAGNCNVLSGMDETKRGDNTIRVSAVGPDLKKANFSNYGNYSQQGINYSDISAPGVDIYSAGPANGYGFCPGTSMAAPIVAGAVALMKSVNPHLTNSQIIDILDKTGKVVDREGHIGKLIQVRDALEMAAGDVANYDKIKEDPNSIVGMWQTTEELDVIDSATGVKTGEKTHVFLKFNSINNGTIYYKKGSGCVYSAPFNSKMENNMLKIYQNGMAHSKTCDRPFSPVTIECGRGENGMLKCRSYYDGKSSGDYYFLVRSNISF